ncbi:MAG: hypothetical protein QGF09_06580 [Rhodospirillales bacterium]|jgi:hypothetical protein|nr:hypothetical protein [Rhodospirillales bacterium]
MAFPAPTGSHKSHGSAPRRLYGHWRSFPGNNPYRRARGGSNPGPDTLYGNQPGTELANLRALANTPTHAKGFPYYPGYSNIAKITEVGAGVEDFRPG